ncbi:hypothetical protein GCM10010197_39760 [Nocardioides luteus]|uniref:Uncharacterized protein n=1 Tax=Nocardioides luteus TaxID=1844 RepID=A0ABQ5SW72_9ACTN|nr:hypothetical protein GCM10010197_39760 [Nocardioides luteus]GLJ68214.1 hypothetical protein GCM10017579_22500 [Nocardioides luteus]
MVRARRIRRTDIFGILRIHRKMKSTSAPNSSFGTDVEAVPRTPQVRQAHDHERTVPSEAAAWPQARPAVPRGVIGGLQAVEQVDQRLDELFENAWLDHSESPFLVPENP